MRSHPVQSGETFDGPPTLERSGSERRGGAVSSLFPEGERVGVRGGAFLKGKEGRVGFRKNFLWLKGDGGIRRCCCYRNILSAHLYLQSIIAGWCGTNPAPVLLLQKRIVSYFECVTSKHFFYIMPESQLFLSAVAQRLDFVVLQDEIAIWTKQVVGHQIGVV